MEIMYQGCEIAATTVETIILLEFLTKLLGSRLERTGRIIAAVAAFIVINGYMLVTGVFFPEYSAMSDIVVLIMYIAYALFTARSGIIYRIMAPTSVIVAIIITNTLVYSVISMIFHMEAGELITGRGNIRLACLFITKFVLFLLTRLILKLVKPKTIKIGMKELSAVSVVFVITVIMSAFAAELLFAGEIENTGTFTLVFFVSIIIINIINFIMLSIIARKNEEAIQHRMVKLHMDEQQKMYDSVSSIYHDLQILQHDLKNELLCVLKYIKDEDNKKAAEYVENLTNTKLGSFHEYVKTDSELLDAVINVKMNYARGQDIDVSLNIGISMEGFDENAIMMLVSNALDNAIESSVKQQNKKQIILNMENKRNYLCITVKNAIDSSVLKYNSDLKTTKENKKLHGLGTDSMQNIVEKYDGMIDYHEENGMFVVDMMVKKDK